jgi:hypothetical protein
MRIRFVVVFKENGEVLKEAVKCDDRWWELTKKERERIGSFNKMVYFDTIDELIEYVLANKKECKMED